MLRKLTSLLTTLSMVSSFFVPTMAQAAARPSPQKVLESLVNQKPAEMTSHSFEATLATKTIAPKKKNPKQPAYYYSDEPMQITFSLNGYTDTRETDILKSFGSLTINGLSSLVGNKAIAANYMMIDKVFYFQYPDKDAIKDLQALATSTPITEQTWFKLDFSDIWKQLLAFRAEAQLVPGSVNGELTTIQEDKLRQAFLKSGLVTLRFAKEQMIDTSPVYTYTLVVNKNKILPFYREASVIIDGKKPTKEEEKELLEMFKELKTLPTITVSVHKESLRLAKIGVAYTSSEKVAYGYVNLLTFTSSLTYTYPNALPTIVEPPNTVDFMTLFDGAMSKYQNTALESINDKYRIADLRRLDSALYLYYVDHQAYPDGNYLLLGSETTRCLNTTGWHPNGCSSPYLNFIYKDPGNFDYRYTVLNNGKSFQVDAELEGIAAGLHNKIILTPKGLGQR